MQSPLVATWKVRWSNENKIKKSRGFAHFWSLGKVEKTIGSSSLRVNIFCFIFIHFYHF